MTDEDQHKELDKRTLVNLQNIDYGKASITHGGYSFLRTGLVPCDRCIFKENGCKFYKPGSDCAIIKAYREEKIKELMRLPWIEPHHIDRVDNYVKLRCLTMVIDKWICKVGLFTKKGRGLDAQPVLRLYFLALNTQERIADKLFLSPAAQREAGLNSEADKKLEDHLREMEIKTEGEPEDE